MFNVVLLVLMLCVRNTKAVGGGGGGGGSSSKGGGSGGVSHGAGWSMDLNTKCDSLPSDLLQGKC